MWCASGRGAITKVLRLVGEVMCGMRERGFIAMRLVGRYEKLGRMAVLENGGLLLS